MWRISHAACCGAAASVQSWSGARAKTTVVKAAFAVVLVVGLIATLLESLLGALCQDRWPWLSNELVNGLQTAWAAGLAIFAAWLMGVSG